MLDLFFLVVIFFLLMIFVMVGVAFLTLLERSVLGYIHIRKGPNSVGFVGIFQPFSDAIKLFTSEQYFPLVSNYLVYYFSPVFGFFLSLLVWLLIPYLSGFISFELGLLFFLACTSLGVYTVMIAGWSSNSGYSLLGGLRALAQTISYEVSLAFILLSFVVLVCSYNLSHFYFFQVYIWLIFFSFPLSFVWFISCLAETNRTPFDFAEGESELVSGFNVEYGGGGFALIFLAEYASILFMSLLFCIIFLGCDLYSFVFYVKLAFISFLFVWVRGTVPRFRYDKLMYLAWSSFLPLSLNYLLFFVGVKCFIFSLL
uniref:NADH dehydrogenase subunit 1 n=1 Tax=Engelitermes zambo TaxID=3109550 RepID=UPI002E765CBD|nr:NADH dehydrogenase subunit 1 [Engelitermes zambo]WQM47284.1 NADH dehydrogenase subunit 1 [Engelitermes zambo]WQM47297.1 NADH dehydrogenase subunit 1 [Engelitermes zambo]WQM47310.1 NADH dehydrogenase subunit 1 [Engelitermes zambo]WQM47323.1 NADH dehydrogenase subunit 1 [Engelitermes zambo]